MDVKSVWNHGTHGRCGDLRLRAEKVLQGFWEVLIEVLVVFFEPGPGRVSILFFLINGHHEKLLDVFFQLVRVNMKIGSEVTGL